MPIDFLTIDVDDADGPPDAIQLRFKRAGASRMIERIEYESEEGIAGWWGIHALDQDSEADAPTRAATETPVEDSSEGTVRLISGGRRGLLLVHEESGTRVREAYLVLPIAAK